jgi:hypothetical protein
MNKKIESKENDNMAADDMRSEYDFSGGVRGKHYRAYRQGHTVRIHQTDGEVIEQHFTLEEGAVFIEPDVREYFPNAEAVNKALRGLIALFPKEKSLAKESE